MPPYLEKIDLVTLLDIHLDVLPLLVTRAGADRQDLAALRLLLSGVGQHDAAGGGGLLFEDLHDQTGHQGAADSSNASHHTLFGRFLTTEELWELRNPGTRLLRVPTT